MKKLLLAALFCSALTGVGVQAQLIGPTTYLSQADSPFNPASFDYFYLEDVEDNLINTPGLLVAGSGLCITGFNCFVGQNVTDSVGNGGNANIGRSIFTQGSTSVTFDALVLGSLPTSAGLVWTDGNNPIRFEAFDQNGVSLGFMVNSHATSGFNGQTNSDRFYGATNAGGISRLLISNPPGTEIDHIQYGGILGVIPEPATWALMIAGFGLVGFSIRLARRNGGLARAGAASPAYRSV